MMKTDTSTGLEIAIIGIGCRFPDADNWREYWRNLCEGHESVRFAEEVQPSENTADGKQVNAMVTLQGKDLFDYAFFDYSITEAALINPLHRVFHQCIWEALEDAGCNPDNTKMPVGLYAGACDDTNWKVYTLLERDARRVDDFTLSVINNRDYLSTLLAYKLNLKGPAININTACSTSLVAVNMACKALLTGETRIAIAGGVSMSSRIRDGYVYQQGMIYSEDGHCRAFDKDASGTIVGEGAGAVVLKRLKDAQADGDHIYAVIKGSAVNNDGNRKVGFTAPSVEGQMECIRKAQVMARVEPDSIGFVEAHGTGTRLGDPIEVAALNKAFNSSTSFRCALGAVKPNIGHLDTAAGIAGLIKAALTLKFRQIPPTINYKEPNPEINFKDGPFYVNTRLEKWESPDNKPRRAAVSSFGIGGTNAHVVLEEAPVRVADKEETENCHLLTLSARSEKTLQQYMKQLSDFLRIQSDINPADLAYTFQTGRRHFAFRKTMTFPDISGLSDNLRGSTGNTVPLTAKPKAIVFMFPGQGAQYLQMGKTLYDSLPVFREWMDKGFEIISTATGRELRAVLWSSGTDTNALHETSNTQPLLFLVEYALAKYLMSIGIRPDYMIGHSLGEWVAASLSGVFSFEDALKLIVERGRLMGSTAPGTMLGTALSREEAVPYLSDVVSLAAVNAPAQTVFSGATDALSALEAILKEKGVPCVRLRTSHAFHSYLQEPVLPVFRQHLEQVTMNKPVIPFIANTTGDFITDDMAVSPDYWAGQLVRPVLFASGVEQILARQPDTQFIETGPGQSLCGMLKTMGVTAHRMVNMMKQTRDTTGDLEVMMQGIGRLWEQGVEADWEHFYLKKRNKVCLPTYPFDAISFPAEVDTYGMLSDNRDLQPDARSNATADWCYQIQWRQSQGSAAARISMEEDTVVLCSNNDELDERILQSFRSKGATCIPVMQTAAEDTHKAVFVVDPLREDTYRQLFGSLDYSGEACTRVIYRWDKIPVDTPYQARAVYAALLNLVRGFVAVYPAAEMKLDVVVNGMFNVSGYEAVCPDKATIAGALRVISLEFSNITCRLIDMAESSTDTMDGVLKELLRPVTEREVAIRGIRRYVKSFEKIVPEQQLAAFKKGGTYLVTGAAGGMGQLLSVFLAEKYSANLVLVSRKALPDTNIRQLELAGAQVYNLVADVTAEITMQQGWQAAVSRFGGIHGILHTAGIPDKGGVILRRNDMDDQQVFAAKITGTQVLLRISQGHPMNFLVCFSSISAITGSFGEAGYVAANAWMDALAETNGHGYPVISLQWTALKETGMAVNSLEHLLPEEKQARLANAITNQEFITVLQQAISTGLSAVVISPYNVNRIVEKRALPPVREAVAAARLVRDRPLLSTPYTAPETATEKKMTIVLSAFTGIENIGSEDSFLDLGIDSLKSMMLMKELKSTFNVDFTLKQLLEYHTVSKLSSLIDEITFITNKTERTSKLTI
ncbi:SDR family NAD(P)-dependent oxidoreductase [Chitinophaga sp. G-6-1-13]|uniref:SDR family NAD(P)-dependent oxidoreductase n=1 Tax=Chitinophaga fulva TaxID=2728842 RepID=A0A848GHB6_9BACT|nr:type I polyketide synthase [Chitinophaga fulva]NML37854.1 SDR family NAD(P)-dependent oxidoreductase [Chitinophaga fulva]